MRGYLRLGDFHYWVGWGKGGEKGAANLYKDWYLRGNLVGKSVVDMQPYTEKL